MSVKAVDTPNTIRVGEKDLRFGMRSNASKLSMNIFTRQYSMTGPTITSH
jgi:hypothetical protein